MRRGKGVKIKPLKYNLSDIKLAFNDSSSGSDRCDNVDGIDYDTELIFGATAATGGRVKILSTA